MKRSGCYASILPSFLQHLSKHFKKPGKNERHSYFTLTPCAVSGLILDALEHHASEWCPGSSPSSKRRIFHHRTGSPTGINGVSGKKVCGITVCVEFGATETNIVTIYPSDV